MELKLVSEEKHEDDRRILEAFPEGKIITAKKDCEIGGHYHKVKTEVFLLVAGWCDITRNGETEGMEIGTFYTVMPGVAHTFKIDEGSTLIGFCSHPYDPKDDYKI